MSNLIRYVPFAAIAVTLIVNDYVAIGTAILLVTAVVAGKHTYSEQRMRQSAQHMAEWLIDAAQYGTRYIQNGTDHDISDQSDVPRLIARHDRWVDVVQAHAASYLQTADADDIVMLHTYPPARLRGFTQAHAKALDRTAARVERLRRVAKRLQDGTTSLKAYRPNY